MKIAIFFSVLFVVITVGCNPKSPVNSNEQTNMDSLSPAKDQLTMQAKYAEVNGIKMYYEVYGAGKPIVLIHGGGSTIGTSFGKIIPSLAKSHMVIGVELQAHGHTSDRGVPSSFEQDADDVAELLKQINISDADILGFSNGGNTAMRLAMRHPERVGKLIIASSFYKRAGMPIEFWNGMKQATFADMPQVYKDAYLKINNDTNALMTMFKRDAYRMQTFQDWKDEDLKSIKAPALIVVGDQDIMKVEHAVEMHRLISNSRLSILPANHGSYMGEVMTPDTGSKMPELFVEMVNEFLLPASQNKH
jgi:pimeloyl-ACP methyl ester carboxylesterase